MSKSLPMQQQARLERTLLMARNIISSTANLPMIEIKLELKDTLNQPLMRSVFKGEHGTIGFSVVKVLVERFIDSFGFATKPSQTVLDGITVDTLEKFAFESLDDIIIFFKMCRQGVFGPTKKGLDSNFIYGEWFPMYLEKKAEIREIEYQKEKSKLNSNEVTYEDIKKTYSKNDSLNFEKKVINYVDEITKDYDRQLLEDLIVDWEKDPQKKPFLYILKKKRLTIK